MSQLLSFPAADGDPPSNALPILLTVARDDAHVRLTVVGDVDLCTAPLLHDALDAALDGRPSRVDVDLSGVTFLDSSGLHALIRASWSAQRSATELAFVCVPPLVTRLLQLTGLWRVLPVASTTTGTARGTTA